MTATLQAITEHSAVQSLICQLMDGTIRFLRYLFSGSKHDVFLTKIISKPN
jgi:hypothetical protein